jgi:hypothetical protein
VSPGEQGAEDVPESEGAGSRRAIEYYSKEIKLFVDAMVDHEKYNEAQLRFLFAQALVQLNILRDLIMASRGFDDAEPGTIAGGEEANAALVKAREAWAAFPDLTSSNDMIHVNRRHWDRFASLLMEGSDVDWMALRDENDRLKAANAALEAERDGGAQGRRP